MTTVADRVLAFLAHLYVNPTSDALLEQWTTGLVAQLERAGLIAYGDPDTGIEPTAAIRDPRVAPLWALPYAAQWTGGTLPPRLVGQTDADYLEGARLIVVKPQGMRRGSDGAIEDVIRPYLTDTQYVRVFTRVAGDRWENVAATLAAENTDIPATQAAANAADVVLAGARVLVRADPGWTIAEFEEAYASQTIADAEGDFSTINDIETEIPA